MKKSNDLIDTLLEIEYGADNNALKKSNDPTYALSEIKYGANSNAVRFSNVLIDTSIILDGVENVTMLDKQNNVFVTDVVLRELDGNKGADGSKGYNAREFFRQLNGHDFKKLDNLPVTGRAVEKNDTLTEGSIDGGAHVYTLSRKWYRAKDINDTKIIEIAKDYDLGLVTLDQAQSARAKSQGIKAGIFKQGGFMSNYNQSDTAEKPKNNLKILAASLFAFVFGVPVLIITGAAWWIGIPIMMIIALVTLNAVMADNTPTEFETVVAKKMNFPTIAEDEDDEGFLVGDSIGFNNEAKHSYAGFIS